MILGQKTSELEKANKKDNLSFKPQETNSLVPITEKIVVMDKNEYVFINTKDIYYAEAKGSYTYIKTKDHCNLLVSKNIKVLNEKLNTFPFIRIHKSFLINLDFIKKYIKTDGGYLIMQDGKSIPISTRRKDTFTSIIDSLSI